MRNIEMRKAFQVPPIGYVILATDDRELQPKHKELFPAIPHEVTLSYPYPNTNADVPGRHGKRADDNLSELQPQTAGAE
jgi:hypothetical protein